MSDKDIFSLEDFLKAKTTMPSKPDESGLQFYSGPEIAAILRENAALRDELQEAKEAATKMEAAYKSEVDENLKQFQSHLELHEKIKDLEQEIEQLKEPDGYYIPSGCMYDEEDLYMDLESLMSGRETDVIEEVHTQKALSKIYVLQNYSAEKDEVEIRTFNTEAEAQEALKQHKGGE